MVETDKKMNNKKEIRSAQAVEAFFKQAENITIGQKISLYRGLMAAALMVLNDERSKEAKRFKYDFDKHVILIKFIQFIVNKEVAEAASFSSFDFQKGLIAFLKMYGAELKDIAMLQLQSLLESVISGVDITVQEKNLLNNPVMINATILHELFMLPVKEVPLLHEAAKKARDCSAERLCVACDIIEKEASLETMGKVRCLWLLELLMQNAQSINYAWGEWRLTKLVERISHDHLANAEQKEELTDREQAMAYDLLVASGRINPSQFDKQHDECGCGHEHHDAHDEASL